MQNRQTAALIALLFALFFSGSAVAAVPRLAVETGTFVERDGARTGQVNGASPEMRVTLPGEIAGLLVGDLEEMGGFPSLYVSGLRPTDRLICLTLTSADGFYEAEGRTRVTTQARNSGEALIVLPTRNSRLMRLPAGQVSALVRVSSHTDKCLVTDEVLAFSWGRSHSHNTTAFKVLIGGSGNIVRPVIRYDDQDTPRFCEPLTSGGSNSGYRWTCSPSATICRPTGVVQLGWRDGPEYRDGPRVRFRRKCSSGG